MTMRCSSRSQSSKKNFDFDLWQTGGGKGTPLPYEQSNFALYWEELPSIVVKDDKTQEQHLEVRGHSVMGRLAVYKYLIETTGCFGIHNLNDSTSITSEIIQKKIWGEQLERHFLWGYASILDWEARSGRLLFPETITNLETNNNGIPPDEISDQSWWGFVNFSFCICILLGAIEAGVVPNCSRLVLDDASQKLVDTDSVVKKSIQWWSDFWKGPFTKFSQSLIATQNKDSSSDAAVVPDAYDCLYDEMNTNEWMVHSRVFQYAVFDENHSDCKSQNLLSQMPLPEQEFAVGFCRIVDMLAALNVRTDLVTTSENGVGYLPLRVLSTTNATTTTNNCMEQKRIKSVQNLQKLSKMDYDTIRKVVSFWKRLAKWKMIRGNISQILDHLTHGTVLEKNRELCKLFFFFLLPGSGIELAGWVALAGTVGMLYSREKI